MSFLHNAWYAAGWAGDFDRTLKSRTFLSQRVVMFRSLMGKVVALEDRCPHRFIPLSQGKLREDTIECAYHGLCFNEQGRCTLNPHGPIPKAAQVRAYSLVERDGIVWIWMGGPEAADPSKIIDFPEFNGITHTAVCGYLHVRANYQLIADNLLDLTHGQYIHPMFAHPSGVPTKMEADQPFDDNTVWAKYIRRNSLPNDYYKMLGFPAEILGDSRNYMRWNPPGTMLLDVGIAPVGGHRRDGVSIPTAHLLTPETETTTHYLWGMARDFRRDDTALSERLRRVGMGIFNNEDKPVIEEQQSFMGSETDLLALNPVLLTTDGPSVRARRLLQSLIAREAAAESGIPE